MTSADPDEWPIAPGPTETIDYEKAAEDAARVQLVPGPDDEVVYVEDGDAQRERPADYDATYGTWPS